MKQKLVIFLSHASEDKAKVRNLCKRLRDDGFDPWLDDCELPYFIHEIQWVDYPADYERLLMSLQVRAGGVAISQTSTKPRTKKAAGNRATNRPSGGNIFNIQGDVHIGRDMIAGHQTNVYYQNQQARKIISPMQFIDELQKLMDEIERLKSQPDVDSFAVRRMDVVQADIQEAIEEAVQAKPSAERINKTLDSAKETIQKLSGSISAAANLGTTLGNLASLAMKLFGG